MTRDAASLTAAASRSEAALSAQAGAADDDEYEDDDTDGSDDANWGLQRPKPRVAKQTIFGLTVIVVLLGMFSVLIFRKLQERKAAQAEQVADAAADAAPKDKPEPKPDSTKQLGKGEGKVRPVNAVVASNSKGKVERASDSADPFESLPELGSGEPPAQKTAGAGRATPRTNHAGSNQNEPYDMGLPEPDSRRTSQPPATRNGLPDSTELADVTPAHRPGGIAERPASGHATVGSGRTPRTKVMANDEIEVVDLPGFDSAPATKVAGAKVGGHSNSGSHSTPKPQPKQDEFPISAGNPSDPFGGNDEPPVTVKRDVKPLRTAPPRHAPKSEEFDAFDPAPAAKPTNVQSLPPESRDLDTASTQPDKFGGFEVAKDPPLKKIPVETLDTEPVAGGESASTANDPRLGGFQPVDNSRTRATSRTVVTRASTSSRSSAESVTAVTGNRPTALTAAVEPTLESEPVVPTPSSVPTPVPTPIGVSPRRQPTPVSSLQHPTPASAATDTGRNLSGETYVIAPNDNFWTISRKRYGTARYFQALTEHNKGRIADPSRVRPGTVISTPPREVLDQQYPLLIDKAPAAPQTTSPKTSSIQGAPTPVVAYEPSPRPLFSDSVPVGATSGVTPTGFFVQDGQPMYRVGQSDTLTEIAQRHLGRASRWDEIYNRNKETIPNPDALKIGTVIRLPTDASRLGFVSEGGERR